MNKLKQTYLPRVIGMYCLSVALISSFAGLAFAAENGDKETSIGGGSGVSRSIEEIIVTARRREEALSDVAASVTAFDSSEIKKRGITTERDIQREAPGLIVREVLSQNNLVFSIRGQTVDAFSAAQPGVLPYINEVQISNTSASTLYDLGSIQVVKGPQGTLFGRNTTGGAVLFETAKPVNETKAFLKVKGAKYDTFEFEGMANLPVIPDKLAIRVAGNHVERDGYVKNLVRGGETLGDLNSDSARLSVMFTPNERFENVLVLEATDSDGTSLSGQLYSLYPCGSGLTDVAACFYDDGNPLFGPYSDIWPGTSGGIDQELVEQKNRGPYDVEFNSPNWVKSNSKYFTNTATFKINDDILIKNIIGWNKSRSRYSLDPDGSPYNIFGYGEYGTPDTIDQLVTGQLMEVEQYSGELQLQGSAFDDRLDYIVGGYYSHQELLSDFNQVFFDFSPIFPGGAAYAQNETTNESSAIFAQGTLDLSESVGVKGLSLTAGYRYTWEEVEAEQLPKSVFYPLIGVVPGFMKKLKEDFNEPSYTIGLDYKMTEELLFYIAHRKSFRSGGFNTFKAPTEGTADVAGSLFKSEITKDIEVGAKFSGSLLDIPAQVNIAVYHQVVDDVQRTVYVNLPTGPSAVTANIPESEIDGVELDVKLLPTDSLSLGFSLANTDADFTDNSVNLFGVTTEFGPFPDAPEWSGNIYVELMLPIPDEMGELSVRADYYSQSDFFFSSTNSSITPGTNIDGYEITNFRLDWSDIAKSGLGFALYVNNAFDEEYYTGGLQVGSTFGLNTAIPAAPRTYGAEISFTY